MILTSVLGLFLASNVWAHDPGLSSANLEVDYHKITARFTFNEREIATRFNATTNEKLTSNAVAQRVATFALDGTAVTPQRTLSSVDKQANIEFTFEILRPSRARELTVRSLLLRELPFGHREAFAARDADGKDLGSKILSARNDSASVSLLSIRRESETTSALDFLLLGIRHILTGYDHLLFLFGLLVVCRDLRSVALVITCFTIAHSITLSLATFDLVRIPGRVVEPVIAASIVFVGAENFVRHGSVLHSRWILTLAFGLVHGLGFATVLRDMGVASTGRSAAIPLVMFNLGVEAGQFAVAGIVLPVLWQLRNRDFWIRIGIPACSILIALLGGYWFFDRVMGSL